MHAEEDFDRKPLIVAMVVLLAFVIGLHAFLYFMTCLDCDGMWQNIDLTIDRGKPTNRTNEYRFEVISVSKHARLSEFEMMVYDTASGSIAIRSIYLSELKTSTEYENGFALEFYDAAYDDVLNGGDFFIIRVPNNETNYEILIIRRAEIIFSDSSSINPSQETDETYGDDNGTRPSNLMGSRPGIGFS
jgi:hypothetical protein